MLRRPDVLRTTGSSSPSKSLGKAPHHASGSEVAPVEILIKSERGSPDIICVLRSCSEKRSTYVVRAQLIMAFVIYP